MLQDVGLHLANRASRRALLVLLASLPRVASAAAGQGLQVAYGNKGIQSLSFNGTVLHDVSVFPGDAFHIWHMKATDLSGNVLSAGQYGWGEINNGESWNGQTQTETYTFSWGSIATQFAQVGDNLNITVTETNNAGSGILFDGAEVFPLALHFPQDPANFYGYSQYAITTTDPGVSVADYGSGVVTSVIPDESLALYGGWKNVGASTYAPIMTGTAPDGLATFLPHNDTAVPPGASLSFTVALRFTPEGTAAAAADAYSSFAAKYPSQMTWTDKRILGTAYLASSPAGGGNITLPGGFPTNPRRYFNDPTVNIYSADGLQAFQNRMLTQAAANVTNAQNMNAQGVITWDIEGEQYSQNTSYVCSPDQIAAVAPEMEGAVTDTSSPYFGQKLDDAYFGIQSSAGLRIGLCLRPQAFTLGGNDTASQQYLTGNAAIVANLENKARFANGRWGATVFYVDSTVDANGGTLDPAIFQQLITDLPNFLFIPEESTTRYYAYTAPFYSFIDHTSLGTPAAVYNTCPKAFGANLVNDAQASTLAQYQPQLTQSVERGDILMGHADYWQANDPTLVNIYQAAGVAGPTSSQTTPTVAWAAPLAITYGTALGGNQLNASANVAGAFTYTPAAGTVLTAGNNTLTANFVPQDTAAYKATTSTVTLTVNQATPAVHWSAPASIAYGTALSAAQLNATASVPGTFTYAPAAGTVLGAGTTQLSATFAPTDARDYAAVSTNVSLTVSPANAGTTPTIAWGTPASIGYGTGLSAAQLNATANVSGSFSYSPVFGTVLNAGTHALTATFTPADTKRYASAITTRTLLVNQAAPNVTWLPPAPIPYGTALSGAQLDAAADVPGTFTYAPGAGTVLNAGTATLTTTFTPADGVNYTGASASTMLTVLGAAPVSRVAILSPSPGAVVSGTIEVLGQVHLALDAAGSHLQVDGVEIGTRAVGGAPFLYELDTTTLTNGAHSLQIWAHDINNDTVLSPPVIVTVAN